MTGHHDRLPASAAALLAALALLVVAAQPRAQFNALDWTLSGCAKVHGDRLTLDTCSPTCNALVSKAFASQPLDGTWEFDASWTVEGKNDFTILFVTNGTGNIYFGLQGEGSPWCGPPPCSGSQHVVVPGHALSFLLDASEDGCGGASGDGHTSCTFTHLTFTPKAGIFPHQGTLEAADLGALPGPAGEGAFGSALALLHDLDGDGRPEVAIGTSNASGFPSSANKVHVRSGATGALLATLTTGSPNDNLGVAVCNPGDLDGDGRDDLVTGAPGVYNLAGSKGQVIAWSSATWTALWTAEGAADGERFGQSVAAIGDINADGIGDVLAGLPGGGAGGSHVGGARAISGADGSLLWEAPGLVTLEGFGTAVAALGDINGDGTPDALAGAPGYNIVFGGPGSVRVLSGRNGASLGTLSGDVAFGSFGASVASAGDADGDGVPDIAVGEPGAGINAGLVRVVSGATLLPLYEIHGASGELLGGTPGCLAAIGDSNGDGRDDLLVGVPHNTNVAGQPGEPADRLDVHSGADGSVLLAKSLPYEPLSFGKAIATGLDLSGDGVPDWAVAGSVFDAFGEQPAQPTVLLWSGKSADNVAPLLVADGTLAPGSPVVVTIADGTPNAPAALVLGLQLANLPLKGGLLVPAPQFVITGLPLDGAGSISLPDAWPAGLSHVPVWMQAWIQSPGAPHGFTATNSLALVAP